MSSSKNLPNFLERPWLAGVWWTIAQIVQLLLNLRDYGLIADELAGKEQTYWVIVLTINGVSILTGIAIWALARHPRTELASSLLCILLPTAYILYGSIGAEGAIPDNVDTWILHPGNLVFNLWACQVLASLLGFAKICCRITQSGGFSTLLSGTLLVVAPVSVLWLLVQILSDLFESTDILFTLFVSVVAVITVVLAFGVFLVAFSLMRAVFNEQNRPKSIALTLLISLVMPIAGLVLNRTIPFPQDYQNPTVYWLTLINAMILAIPVLNRPWQKKIQLWATAAVLPFSLYFFCAFLPFYPLSALAMIVVGSGFLILTPVLLSILHLGKIVSLSRVLPTRRNVATLIILGVAVLPSIFLLGMLRDRAAILEALDYSLSPDPASLETPPSPKQVERVIRAVKRQSRGIQYPILSPLYRAIVLQGMTLPDSSLTQLETTFGLAETEDHDFRAGFWGMRERGPNLQRRMRPASVLAEMADAELSSSSPSHATLSMEVINQSRDSRTGFRQDFKIPPGVWVAGAELLIGDSWKPADIRERRSAEWIYRTIASERIRDPLLVTLDRPGQVEIEVFPVDRGSPRQLRINLRSAANLPITLGMKDTLLETHMEQDSILQLGSNLLIPANLYLPQHTLRPVYNLFLDRSTAAADIGAFQNELITTLKRIPIDASLRWWIIRDGIHQLPDLPQKNTPALLAETDLSELIRPQSGGRSKGHVQLAIIHQWRQALQNGKVPESYPVIVPIGWPSYYTEFTRITQFVDPYLGATPQWILDQKEEIPAADKKVSIFRRKDQTGVVPAELKNDTARWAFLFETSGTPEILNTDRQFEEISTSLLQITRVPDPALRAYLTEAYSRYNPALHEDVRENLISLSKKFSVLLPETALIALENSAQEEFLKRLEKIGQDGHSGLSFSETPEPTTLPVIGFTIWMLVRRHRKE
ncbi:MSEP-CTERM sorting domain-containing protein [Puniceicoccus vermicola]|uniref:MSEP-CTERM sorting domain-containing protein n=1 Tax=Puniceicoccus vermicola TaxID=388746 RepID=A0A7X1B021_9BACT|nr:MSEP-CTERM sorting domain-containing protein [Puniceicoccus vermicola]MBC2603130.1 MSEP-CTERM sorting domain-containing protein [Puniceicoccus vermicola]